MSVKTESLENAERDIDVTTREARAGKPTATNDAAAQLRALRQRITAGLNRVGEDPHPKDAPACRECFQRGWMTALRSLQD